jgi:hypothetical protein
MKPSVFRVIKYDGLISLTLCFTYSIQTAIDQIEKDINAFSVAYRTRVKRLLDRNPPVVVLTLCDENGFVREWQYSIYQIRVIE